MENNIVTTLFLPLALAVIMLGLGLSLALTDFKRILRYPLAVVVGLVCQTLLLPLICFGIAVAFELPPELAVGLMLLAASPGGATANLFSHLARGDVALNITLTATNGILSLLTMPLIVSLAVAHFMAEDRAVPVEASKVIQVFGVVLVPVALGMLLRARKPPMALRLERPVRVLSALFLVLVVAAAIAKERANILSYFQQVGVAALVFNLASMSVGYFVPRLLRLPKRQAVAIGMEIGIHNGTLAIAIANTVLLNSTMAIPPAIYSLIMFVTAGLFGAAMSRSLGKEGHERAPVGLRPAVEPSRS